MFTLRFKDFNEPHVESAITSGSTKNVFSLVSFDGAFAHMFFLTQKNI